MRTQYLTSLGSKVRARREALSFTQGELAARAAVHRNVIGRLERGGYNPTVLTLLAVARALRTPVQELV
jgi:transcriptional regulator with XRE-family HTH domain